MEDATTRRLRRGLAGLLGAAAVSHLVAPASFETLVPRWLPGAPRGWNLAATAAEVLSAVLLARRSTARTGGWVALLTFAGVWVANLEAARRGGYPGLPPPLDGPVAAWLRVPLQLPLLWWSYRIACSGDPAAGSCRVA